MNRTKIEWADLTWNPISGCTKVSDSCTNCYAERMAKRLAGRCGYPKDAPFTPTFHGNQLSRPLHWMRPYRIFVGSMGDLFHEAFGDATLDKIFAVMGMSPQHTFLVLTKRPKRMCDYLKTPQRYGHIGSVEMEICKRFHSEEVDYIGPQRNGLSPPNVWLGVTAENQQAADERIPILLSAPAAKRFVSVEPMLGPIDLNNTVCIVDALAGEHGGCRPLMEGNAKLDWVICGGETGPRARPMHPDWVRGLRDQCQEAGVPFYFKGWGGIKGPKNYILDGRTWEEVPQCYDTRIFHRTYLKLPNGQAN